MISFLFSSDGQIVIFPSLRYIEHNIYYISCALNKLVKSIYIYQSIVYIEYYQKSISDKVQFIFVQLRTVWTRKMLNIILSVCACKSKKSILEEKQY